MGKYDWHRWDSVPPLFTEEQLKRGLTEEDWKRAHEEEIELFGQKGVTFDLCRYNGTTLCQDPTNRKHCLNQKNAPVDFALCGGCRYCLHVDDGLIIVE